MEIKQSTSQKVLVRLLDASGTPITGITYSGATAVIGKADATETTLTLSSSADWQEADKGLTGKGIYWLTLPTSATDVTGDLVYCVSASGAVDFVRAVTVVANLESDTYTKVVDVPDMAKLSLNRIRIDSTSNRLNVYEGDGVTIAFSYDLKDIDGASSALNVTERIPT